MKRKGIFKIKFFIKYNIQLYCNINELAFQDNGALLNRG